MSAYARVHLATQVLQLAREAYDGSVMVLKGLHSATFYPAPHLRPFDDIDLLVDDPERAQRALIGAGFAPIAGSDGYYDGLHHLRPLISPGPVPIAVEVHRRLNWPDWAEPPSSEQLLAAGMPGIIGVDGVLALPPAHHALASAVHSWVGLPFKRLIDLVDVAAAMNDADRRQADALARLWNMTRIWHSTLAAMDFLLAGGPRPLSVQIWARNLEQVRDRTVSETHMHRVLGPIWARPPLGAAAGVVRAVIETALPSPSDSWRTKLRRARLAVDRRSMPSSRYGQMLGRDARRAPRFRQRR